MKSAQPTTKFKINDRVDMPTMGFVDVIVKRVSNNGYVNMYYLQDKDGKELGSFGEFYLKKSDNENN